MDIIFKNISEEDIRLIAEILYPEIKEFCIQGRKETEQEEEK